MNVNYRVIHDVLVPSTSAAAAGVCGGNRNGREVWKTETGKKLKHLEEALVAAEPGKGQPTEV